MPVFPSGGGGQLKFSFKTIEPYIVAGENYDWSTFVFLDHVDGIQQLAYPIYQNFVHANIPVPALLPYLSVHVVLKVAHFCWFTYSKVSDWSSL